MSTAQQWVTELATGTAQAFPHIKRTDVLVGLTQRLATPAFIDQEDASLCGPACFMYCLASRKNSAYAQYVVELYQTGKATLGRLTVEPSAACKAYAPGLNNGIDPHPVDWVALAGLRDSENTRPTPFDFNPYDETSDQYAGITLPRELKKWFKMSGFTAVADYTNLVLTQDAACINAAGNRYLHRHCVCLFIDINLLEQPNHPIPTVPNHWVVLTSPVAVKQKRVSFRVYSWGGMHKVDLPVEVFEKKFYGYVSAVPTVDIGVQTGKGDDRLGRAKIPASEAGLLAFPTDALFDVDKSTILPAAAAVLKNVAALIAKKNITKATIEGHTDSTGKKDYNLGLSKARADAVKNWLILNGVHQAAFFTTTGKGESTPIASNATSEGKQRNRRVVIRFN
jgi:outer membrane protein OmpA-like peptidoglycan-associated protein